MSENSSTSAPKDRLETAADQLEEGALQDAEKTCREILEASPKNSDAINLLGLIAHRKGDHEAAVGHFDKAIGIRPNTAVFHGNRGDALQALDKMDGAIASYRRAAELDASNIDAQLTLGRALQSSVRIEDAIRAFRKALAVDSDSVEALHDLGNALQTDGRLEEAANAYRKAVSLDPGIAKSHDELGDVLRELGRNDEALACYRKAVSMDPSLSEVQAKIDALTRPAEEDDSAAG